MIYFDVEKETNDQTPPRLRKHFFVEFIKQLTFPLKYLYDSFYLFFNKNKYDVSMNGQVINLEHLLNENFDKIDQSIFISDGQGLSPIHLFNQSEGNELTHLFNRSEGSELTHLFNRSEINSNQSFIVNIPNSVIIDNESHLIALIDKYKQFGKKYSINYLN